jgi:hypothetical protein
MFIIFLHTCGIYMKIKLLTHMLDRRESKEWASSSPFHIASASPGRVLLGHDGVIDLTEGGGWLREFSKSSGIGMRGSALNVKVN